MAFLILLPSAFVRVMTILHLPSLRRVPVSGARTTVILRERALAVDPRSSLSRAPISRLASGVAKFRLAPCPSHLPFAVRAAKLGALPQFGEVRSSRSGNGPCPLRARVHGFLIGKTFSLSNSSILTHDLRLVKPWPVPTFRGYGRPSRQFHSKCRRI